MREYIRVWKELDLSDIEKNLIVAGDLSCDCFACRHIGIEKNAVQCPNCGAHFKYMAFRRRVTSGYLKKLFAEMPYLTFIEFDDFKALTGKSDARKLLDL